MTDDPKFGRLERALAAWTVFRTGQPPHWFGSHEPPQPVAPPATAGRRWDFPPAINLQQRARADEEIDFGSLRALAENYDLLRLVIETRKDQVHDLKWSLQARDGVAADKGRIKAATDFLQRPDREHDWDQWIRILLEDMLVIDAATIYPRMTLGGQLHALEPVDGATIKRIVDDWGRTPSPPEPAYQQILHGMPATDYRTDELLYLVRNPRVHKLYGMSAVQQIVLSVNTGLRRAMHKLNYYTEGTVPDALCGVPDAWTVEQIGEFQEYFDALLTDNSAEKRKIRFVPAGIAKAFVQTKEALLKDEFDEWLARIACYAFSVSNQWAVKQMNRATSETAQDQATKEGLAPTQKWIKGTVDRCLTGPMGFPDLELKWDEERQANPQEQANTTSVYMSRAAMVINEVRAGIGLPPIPGGDIPLIYTASGAVPLSRVLEPPPEPAAPTPPDRTQDAPGQPHVGATRVDSPDDAGVTEAMAKRATPEDRLATLWTAWFEQEAPVIGRMIVRLLPEDLVLRKAAGDGLDGQVVAEDVIADPAVADAIRPARGAVTAWGGGTSLSDLVVNAIAAAIGAAEWPAIEVGTANVLREAAVTGVEEGVAKARPVAAGIVARGPVGGAEASASGGTGRSAGWSTTTQDLRTADATKLANPRAVAFAEAQAADLVSGVDDATRNALRKLVMQAVAEGRGSVWLQQQIETSAAFSADRAQVIARNEIKRAYAQGSLIGWRAMQEWFGIVLYKRVILGPDENHCVACLAAVAEGSIPVDEEFVAGDAPPFHPRCGCALVPGKAPAALALRADEPMAKGVDQPRDGRGRWAATGYDAHAEAARGVVAMDRVLRDKIDVHDAMNAPGLGPVSFLSGTPGKGVKFREGYGVTHIVAKRDAEGLGGEAVARAMPATIAHGTYGEPRGPVGAQRVVVTHGEHSAVLSQGHGGTHWLLTGWR